MSKKISEIWCLSDNHFFHDRIIGYCHRPFNDVEHMNSEMEKRWNLIVSPQDLMIHIGDLSASLGNNKDSFKELIGRLNGKKILVRGNHDHLKDEWYIEAGFIKVVDYIYVSPLLFTHVPDVVDAIKPHPWADITKKLRETFSPELVVHGHDHRTNTPEYEKHFNCASDRHAFMPISLREILKVSFLSEKIDEVYDGFAQWVENDKKDIVIE